MAASRFTQEYKDRRREQIRRQLGLRPRPVPQRSQVVKQQKHQHPRAA